MTRIWWAAIGVLMLVSVVLRQEVLFLICVVLMLLAGAARLWAHYCLAEVHYKRRLGVRRLFFGEETDLLAEIVNAKPLPLAWLRVDDEIPVALEMVSGQPLEGHMPGRRRLVVSLSMRWYERVTRRYRVRGSQRGVWRLGPAQLRSGDIFGFEIRRRVLADNVDTVIVYPRMVPVQALGLPAHHPLGDQRSTLRIIEDPLRLMGAREYAQGDSYRFIHWKATARRSSLQTKVFELSTTRPLALFLNVATAEHFFEGTDWELREYAITAAASIVRAAWQEQLAVGLYVNTMVAGHNAPVRLPPRHHPNQMLDLLDTLARIDSFGRWPIERLVQSEARRLAFGSTVVVISAVINPRLRAVLAELRRREYGVALIGLGDATLDPPLPNIAYHHIGGHERWHALDTLELV